MFGPVFTLELLRERRRGRGWRLAAWGYACLLAWQVMLCLHDTSTGVLSTVEQFVALHFLALALVAPALAAPAFAEEKARGTLAELFTTSLTSAEIVAGKLLARSLRALDIILPSLPVLAVVGGYAGLPLLFFAALFVLSLAVVLAVSAVGLVGAVASKHASGAVIAAYALLGGGAAAVVLIPLPALNPMETLARVADQPGPWGLIQALGAAVLNWLAVAAGCFGLAVWRLRPDALRQMQGGGPRRGKLASRRPPVGDDPIRWKEYYTEGLAVLPLLRRVGRPWGVLAAGGLAIVATSRTAIDSAGSTPSPSEPSPWPFVVQGVLFLLAASLIVTVRSAGAVSGERERDTWDSLRLTALDGRSFLRGKLRGIFDSVTPYFIAYALPAVLLSLPCGTDCVLITVASLAAAGPLMYYMAASGLRVSVLEPTTWRAVLAGLWTGYVTGFFVCWVIWIFSMALAFLSGSLLVALFAFPAGAALFLILIGRRRMREVEARALTPPEMISGGSAEGAVIKVRARA